MVIQPACQFAKSFAESFNYIDIRCPMGIALGHLQQLGALQLGPNSLSHEILRKIQAVLVTPSAIFNVALDRKAKKATRQEAVKQSSDWCDE